MDLYEDFMPWSQSFRILWRKHDDDDQVLLDAKIEVGFKFFVERYILHVQLAKATQPDQGKYPSIPFPIPQKKDPHLPCLLLSVWFSITRRNHINVQSGFNFLLQLEGCLPS
jgi:hypothetical protein